jgi:hypothetical protein
MTTVGSLRSVVQAGLTELQGLVTIKADHAQLATKIKALLLKVSAEPAATASASSASSASSSSENKDQKSSGGGGDALNDMTKVDALAERALAATSGGLTVSDIANIRVEPTVHKDLVMLFRIFLTLIGLGTKAKVCTY